ncbi:LOW QUALITY PROTEIN: hypothetical protein CFOL_v3_16224, partial [Cephalotus follicularis]
MGSRVPVQHYNLRSGNANSFIGERSSGPSSLHDLNSVDSRPSDMPDDSVHQDALDHHHHHSSNPDCMHESYRNSLPLHSVGVEEEDASTLENNESSRSGYDVLTIEDVSPIESARARFLQIIVDNFINDHVIEVADNEAGYATLLSQDKLNKRKTRDVQYEGDSRFALPLMYVANMETLVNDVNMRLVSLNGIRDKTIGVALEAAGGLYRRLAKKFPKKGSCIFKRRELATSAETRTKFPELVIQDEKRIRFVVVNGLDIVEKPNNMSIEDAEWFKRLTGRNEVSVSPKDYKFYSPRHKYRRVASNSSANNPSLPTLPRIGNSSTMVAAQGLCLVNEPQSQHQTPSKHRIQPYTNQHQFHPIHQSHHHPLNQSQHAAHFSRNHQCGPPSHLPDISHAHHTPTISQHIACLQPLMGAHMEGRLHVTPTSPPKYCDECGAPYLREASKFCSECGVKRLGT